MATPMTASQFVSALRAEGVKVSEHAGWRTHNRAGHGAWGPMNGVLIHHTAGSNSLSTVYNGRSDLPGPLAHTHLAKNGTATMVGNGRANHAGTVAMNAFNAVLNESSTHPKPSASSGTIDGNARFYGIEIENLGNSRDPYPAKQYDAAVRWAAAICRHHGWSAQSVVGHKETSVEGKIDPSFNMNTFRSDVAKRLAGSASAGGTATEEDDPMAGYSKTDIAKAVWESDIIPAPDSSSTKKTNVNWQAVSVLRDIDNIVRAMKVEQAAQGRVIETLAQALAAGGPVDADALVAKIRAEIAKIQVHIVADSDGS